MDDLKRDQSSDKGVKAPNVVKDDIDVNTTNRDVKAPKVFGRVKEEFGAILDAIHQRKEERRQNSPSNVESLRDDATCTRSKHEKQSSLVDRKETHGKGDDINADTPINELKGPNIFHRAKEEIEALVDTIQSKRESDRDVASPKKQTSLAESRASPRHRKENHGRGEDIDPDTPVSEFKGPNIFHRAKEEIEAIVDTIQSKKESDRDTPSPKKQSSLAVTDHKGSPSHPKKISGRADDTDVDTQISEFKGPNIFHRAKEEIEAIVDTFQPKKESDDAGSPKKDGFRASISKKLQKPRNRD